MKIADVDAAMANIPVARTPNQRDYQGTSSGNAHEIRKSSGEKGSQLEVTSPGPDRILLSKFEGANDAAQAVAQQIRSVHSALEVVEKHLEGMKQTLEGVAKAYPPYPLGSAERVAALRQFVGLRKIIDQLTFPPPDDSPDPISAESANSFSASHELALMANEDQDAVISGYQHLHTGADGLGIPQLSTAASDEEIQDALNRVVLAHQTMQQRRESFIREAHKILASVS